MRHFRDTDRSLLEAGSVLPVETIADSLQSVEGANLDGADAMEVADAIRNSMSRAMLAVVEEKLGWTFGPRKKTVYWRQSVVKRDDPGACGECGITPRSGWETVDESGLSRADVPESVAERLDRGERPSEDCPGCGRTMAMYGAFEVEE